MDYSRQRPQCTRCQPTATTPEHAILRISTHLTDAAKRLEGVSDSARLDAELLLAHTLGESRTWLFVHAGDSLSSDDAQAFEDLVLRRLNLEPVAYIVGRKEFWSVELNVTPATLVPRPETERLVEVALSHIQAGKPIRVADLGTGSGAIAIAIALERPEASLTASDVSAQALAIAAQNARYLNLESIEFLESDWVAGLSGKPFDVVVSNPPYVGAADPALARLQKEPLAALASGADGLDAIRHLAVAVKEILKINGCFVFEHGADQPQAIMEIMSVNGWKDVHQFKDYAGLPRVTSAVFRG